jgi:hypothetical protein
MNPARRGRRRPGFNHPLRSSRDLPNAGVLAAQASHLQPLDPRSNRDVKARLTLQTVEPDREAFVGEVVGEGYAGVVDHGVEHGLTPGTKLEWELGTHSERGS